MLKFETIHCLIYHDFKDKSTICPICDEEIKFHQPFVHLLKKHQITRQDCYELLSKSKIGKAIIKENKVSKHIKLSGKQSICLKYNLWPDFVRDFFAYKNVKMSSYQNYRKGLVKLKGEKVKELYYKKTPLIKISKKLNIAIHEIKFICLKLGFMKHKNVPKTKCFICNEKLSRASIASHIKARHNITFKQYKEMLIADFLQNKQKTNKLIEMYVKKHATQKEIYESFGLTLKTLKEILRRLNIRIRHRSEHTTKRKRSNWFLYKDEFYQSSWELLFAWWLEFNHIEFKAHSQIGYILYNDGKRKRKYFPDFYVPSWQCYVDIKGLYDKEEKIKFKKIRRSNPNLTIKVLLRSFLTKNKVFKIEALVNKNKNDYAIVSQTKEFQIDVLNKNKQEIFEIMCKLPKYENRRKVMTKFNIRFDVIVYFLEKCSEELCVFERAYFFMNNYKTLRS